MTGVAGRVGNEAGEPLTRTLQGAGKVCERRAVAGNGAARAQGFDQVQRAAYIVKGLFAVEFGEDDAEAVFPQRVGADEHARFVVKQHDRMGVVPRCGQHLPAASAQRQGLPRRHALVGNKTFADLAGCTVAQDVFVPGQRSGVLARWNGDAAAEGTLHCGVAAAVVGVQVCVDHLQQHLAGQALLQQGHRLCGVQGVAAVDQHRAFAGAAVQQHVVGRKPAAFEDGQSLQSRCA